MDVMSGVGIDLRLEMVDEAILNIDGHPFLHGDGLGPRRNGMGEQRATPVSGITDAAGNACVPSFKGGAE